jgi:hypothetical protein
MAKKAFTTRKNHSDPLPDEQGLMRDRSFCRGKFAACDSPPKALALPTIGQSDSRNRRHRYRVVHPRARRCIQLIDYGMIRGSAVLTLWYVRLWFSGSVCSLDALAQVRNPSLGGQAALSIRARF